MYGPLPVEVAFFLDGGVTWNKGEKPSFFNGNARAGLERRHHAPHESAGLRGGADRLRAAVRSTWTGMDLGILADAGILRVRGVDGKWQMANGILSAISPFAICHDRRAFALV